MRRDATRCCNALCCCQCRSRGRDFPVVIWAWVYRAFDMRTFEFPSRSGAPSRPNSETWPATTVGCMDRRTRHRSGHPLNPSQMLNLDLEPIDNVPPFRNARHGLVDESSAPRRMPPAASATPSTPSNTQLGPAHEIRLASSLTHLRRVRRESVASVTGPRAAGSAGGPWEQGSLKAHHGPSRAFKVGFPSQCHPGQAQTVLKLKLQAVCARMGEGGWVSAHWDPSYSNFLTTPHPPCFYSWSSAEVAGLDRIHPAGLHAPHSVTDQTNEACSVVPHRTS